MAQPRDTLVGELDARLAEVHLPFRGADRDPFGCDPKLGSHFEKFLSFLFDSYFRVQVEGLENVPSQGRVLLVCNHSGALPYDGAMLKIAIERKHPAHRRLRFLVEDFAFRLPFVGELMNRVGGVPASQDNARRLLENEEVVAVFPEGIKGLGKLYRDRYRLQRFGRGGFVRLALRSGSPILPVAVVGAEEIHPVLAKLTNLAKPFGLPYLPITPTFPWLGPFGFLPLPTRWVIRFAEPIEISAGLQALSRRPLTVHKLTEKVRATIQAMLLDMVANRKNIF